MKKFLLILLIFVACQSDDDAPYPSEDYIIFGQFYGECVGESCVEIYMLTDTNLYEDSKDVYPSAGNPYSGNFILLDHVKYDEVKDLKDMIPQELFAEADVIIGQPDAGDWGGIYFEISTGGKQEYWLIDKMESNLPDYLFPFVEEIESKILLIND